MSLVSSDKYYIPFHKNQITDLPLDQMEPYEISEYEIEKYYLSNGKYINKVDFYPIIEFKNEDKEKIESLNYSKNYIPQKKGCYDIGGEYFFFQRKKINIIIFIINNEIKMGDMNELLFYIINNCPDKDNSISITSIVCSYNYISEFRPVCFFHDKPYHFYDEYVSNHKEEYDKFIKSIDNIYKVYSINLYELKNNILLEDLNIYPLTLPSFIIYDRNFRILYKDNLFQETPDALNIICQNIYKNIENPYNPKEFQCFMKKCPIVAHSFFHEIEKCIEKNKIFGTLEEFNQEKEKILDFFRKESLKEENKDKSCKIYFTKKYQGLTKEELESINDNKIDIAKFPNIKITYLKPLISINPSEISLPTFLYDSDYLIFPKKFRNNMNDLLHYTWKCALSFCENNNIKNSEFQCKTTKKISNKTLNIARSFNVIYNDGFDYYYIPLNFNTLFKDKTKYFSINLIPKLIPSQKYKLKFKDSNTKEREIEIKKDEITIFQYFREDLYLDQFDLSETINKLKEENPGIRIKYYIVILIAGDKFKNSIYFDKVMKFLNQCTGVDNVLFYTYLIDEFHELTKYLTMGPYIYIFGLKKELVYFEMVPEKNEKTKELLIFNVNKLLLKSYEKNITRNQYNLLKALTKDFLQLNKLYPDKTLLELELTKIKYFDGKETEYYFKFYNYEKKVWENEKEKNQQQEVVELKKKLQDILILNESNSFISNCKEE
jgi:hypothetical protein